MSDDPSSIPAPAPDAESKAKREYGQDIAIDALLETCYRAPKAAPHTSSAPKAVEATPEAELRVVPSPRRRIPSHTMKAAAIAAMCTLSAVGLVTWLMLSQGTSDQPLALVDAATTLKVRSLDGPVKKLNLRSNTWTHLEPGSAVTVGERIQTDDNASITFAYADGSTLELEQSSELELQSVDKDIKAKSLLLSSGKVHIYATPQSSTFTASTPYAKAEVLGTSFSLAVKNASTELVVDSGEVSFQRSSNFQPSTAEESIIVHSGEQAELGPAVEIVRTTELEEPYIKSFSIFSIKDERIVYEMLPQNGTVQLSLATLPKEGFNIFINIEGEVSQVYVNVNGKFHTEKFPPYTVGGDRLVYGEKHNSWEVEAGTYRIVTIPTDQDGNDRPKQELTIQFTD
ncbi:FecR family protein [Coraliomargarita akajimensis]|uniref:FecR protein n=1 Tax=Coraliomargarita akajimensis (strain DSM 45221 / IAM 15411 / JCM 23193 / KCTC 12865 / 04OKA010-24) TaxID=583355 RepID=D5EQJ7_CORAD|nr:FecR family protein [Coraliomargarita akajimensis]ADE55811.1 FecR protein [Coraliomargarita akajimensis DSM 45221]